MGHIKTKRENCKVEKKCNGRRRRRPQTLAVEFPTIASFLEPSSSAFSSGGLMGWVGGFPSFYILKINSLLLTITWVRY